MNDKNKLVFFNFIIMKCWEVKWDFVLWFKWWCKCDLKIEDAYRCTWCWWRFHRNCIFEHFEIEEWHSISHNALNKISKITKRKKILDLCKEWLSREKQNVRLF